MLLDRKRIRKWAKWVALGLAIVFALSFLFLGIGYGGAGFDLSAVFSGGCSETTEPPVVQSDLDRYLTALEADPNDTDAMQGAATIYLDMYRGGQGEGQEYLLFAAALLEKAIEVEPTLKDVYIRLTDLYVDEMGTSSDVQKAVTVLNKAIGVDPDNPEIYLKLGLAQRSLGNTEAAVLAWQKYLQLDPDGEYASLIRQELEELAAGNTTSTAGTTTTTTLPPSPTTAPTTTPTTG